MENVTEWEEVYSFGPVIDDDFFELTHKLKVPGGYIYRCMAGEAIKGDEVYLHLSVGMVFVPSGQTKKKKKKSTRKQ